MFLGVNRCQIISSKVVFVICFFSIRTLDLRSKLPEYGASQRLGNETGVSYAKSATIGRSRITETQSEDWQPLHVETSSKWDNEPLRAPRLSAISGPQHFQNLQSIVREIPSGQAEGNNRGTYSNQFSVSFEGISDAGPMGARLSPVGSSCWSSEQHISPDLASLISSSTNSVSAGRSLSSGKHPAIHGHLGQQLQRQPSSGTGCSGGAMSIEPQRTQSASQSVRSAPLCLGSPIQAKCFRQLTLDVPMGAHYEAPAPPSLFVSDPEEELHKRRLQIYVFAIRCIAYPILSPTSQGPIRRYLKVTKDYLITLKERFQLFLKGEMPITCDEAFRSAISDFYDVVLESDRIASMVKSGSCSMYDIREIFITNVDRRFQHQQTIEGMTRESVISAWKIKFDQICRGGERPCPVAMKLAVPQPETVAPTKEQQYEMLMRTLSVEKYEHQVLYNACQLDNADEQAAELRRELSERLALIERMAKDRSCPKLVHKEMESQYIEEERLRVNELIRRVNSIPVLKNFSSSGSISQRRFHKNPIRSILPHRTEEVRACKSDQELHKEADLWSKQCGLQSSSLADRGLSSSLLSDRLGSCKDTFATAYHGQGISREAVRMSFDLEVLIHQLRNIRHLSGAKKLYCTVELDGTADRKRTEAVEATKPIWNTAAEFQTYQPLPVVKLKLYKECSGPLTLDDKELGKIILRPTWASPRMPTWLRLQPTKHCPEILEIQLSTSMQRPTNCKYANYCWIQGRNEFKKWKRRYLCLIQVSQYTFVLAAYLEQKSHPHEFMVLDGFTVDYCESRPELILAAASQRNKPDHHLSSTSLTSMSKMRFSGLGRFTSQQRIESASNVLGLDGDFTASYFFKLVREGDSVMVATSTEVDRQSWVQAIYRATGQTHKPSLPNQTTSTIPVRGTKTEAENANQPSGIEDLATKPAHLFNHLEFFTELQARSLDLRLQDSFVSLGWLSPGQRLLLEEYCQRYGIRECQRHLAFLKNLLDKAEHGVRTDPDLIHISYSLCANHVSGKTHHDQAVHTVLAVEREQFQVIKRRLTILLERQITEFRYCFPFGRPEGALEKTISLLERVLTKETGEPASADIVRNAIKNCLRNAAVLNYERISEYASIEGNLTVLYSTFKCLQHLFSFVLLLAVSGIRLQANYSMIMNLFSNSFQYTGVDTISKRVFEMMHLAELCIEVLKQNEEHHAESFSWFSDLFVAHAENFWSLFQMDLFELLDDLPDYCWEIFDLFQLLNDYLRNDPNLCNGNFHQNLSERFSPLVDRYLDLMAESMEQSLISGYQNERWLPAVTVVSKPGRLETMLNGAAQTIPKIHAPLVVTNSAPFPNNSPDMPVKCTLNVPSKDQSTSATRPKRHSAVVCRPSISTELPNQLGSSPPSFPSETFVCAGNSPGLNGSRACQTVVELLWRLHKLKRFVQELAWPDPVKAKALDERVRVLCAQMLREAVKRTLVELECTVRKCGKTPEMLLPAECCTMLNTITELRSHLFSLCQATEVTVTASSPRSKTNQTANHLHIETEEFFESIQRSMMIIIIDQFTVVLNTVLNKLTRFDENKIISSILTFTKPNNEEGRAYATFLHSNLQQLSESLVDEVSMIALCEKTFSYFELQGLPTAVLDTIVYQTVSQRLQVEETTQCVKQESGSTTPSGMGRRKLLDSLGGGISGLSGNALFHRN
ncbi:calcium-dependent secretion activator [Paragonimus westermani]|uniref:Calcium-dependent secretion activator n=1 Tax=Paragonimus westermani TaxID=34504 RepID=A0A5J4P1G6_9TREM|nr:calcium-dependent secretion activator [Paragonimus westermani]